METSLHYGLKEKQLGFRLRERISTKAGPELKGKGLFNTVSGGLEYRATLQHVMSIGSPLVEGAAGTPLQIGVGVAVTSADRERPLLTASARKRFQLLEGPNTLLSVRTHIDFDPRSQETVQRAAVRLHHKFPAFTKQQDLRLTVGVDLEATPGTLSGSRSDLYLQVRENNWALHYQNKALRVSYDL